MKLHFKISYFTYWGQRLLVTGNIPELGNNDLSKALPLNYNAPEDWSVEVEVNRNEEFALNYRYVLLTEQTGKYEKEWGSDRNLLLSSSKMDHYFCNDIWNSPASIENVFLSTPFQNVLLKSKGDIVEIIPVKKYTHIFKVKMPMLHKNEALCLIGDCEALGNWSTIKPTLLAKIEDYWILKVNINKVKTDIHYKYGVCDAGSGQFKYFESGPDRTAPVYNSKKTIVQPLDDISKTTTKSN